MKLYKRDKGPGGGGSPKKSPPGIDKKLLHDTVSKLDTLVSIPSTVQPAAIANDPVPPVSTSPPPLVPAPVVAPAPQAQAPVTSPPVTPSVPPTLPSPPHPPAEQPEPINQQSTTPPQQHVQPPSLAASDLRPMNLGVGLSELPESINTPTSTTSSSAMDTISTTTALEAASQSISTAIETASAIPTPQQQQSTSDTTNQPMKQTNISSTTSTSSNSSQSGLVAGLTIGVLSLVLLIYFIYSKRRNRIKKESALSLQESHNTQDYFKNVPSYLAKTRTKSFSNRQDSFASTININDLSQNYQVPSIQYESYSASLSLHADAEDSDTILSNSSIGYPAQFQGILPPPPQQNHTPSTNLNASTCPPPLQSTSSQPTKSHPLQQLVITTHNNNNGRHIIPLANPVVGTLAERMAVYDRIRLSNMPTPSD